YSDADAKALHVRMADEAVHIGPSPARESYLVGDKIIYAAKATKSEAIHPGYGFLSENADFAQAVIDAGLIWVGPKPDSIRAMGLKDAAKKLMAEAGVPVTPGYLGEDQDPKRLKEEAALIGYPVLIKAVAGGGGKGMRKVDTAADFRSDAGLIWVGPKPDSIRAMGLKDAAKKLMAEAGVPVTPGYLGEDQDPKRLKEEAALIGYPVLIKAVAGGGGKGMRKVDTAADF